MRHLTGFDETRRQRLRDQVLGTRAEDFHTFSEVLENLASVGRVVVMGSQASLNAANQNNPGWLAVQKIL